MRLAPGFGAALLALLFLATAPDSARALAVPGPFDEADSTDGVEEAPGDRARLVSLRRIWNKGPHNAFTDLIRHENAWFVTFREGKSHVSPDGAIRVLRSEDGKTFKSVARITSDKADLRDPKITRTPTGRLMITAAAAFHQPAEHRHRTQAFFSDHGLHWSKPRPVGEPDSWLWRVTWHEGVAYGVGYGTGKNRFVRLYRSTEGRNFEVLVKTLFEGGVPSEATLRFLPDHTALCLLRRGRYMGRLGHARARGSAIHRLDLDGPLGSSRRTQPDRAARRPPARRGPALRRQGAHRAAYPRSGYVEDGRNSRPALGRGHQLPGVRLARGRALHELLRVSRGENIHLPGPDRPAPRG